MLFCNAELHTFGITFWKPTTKYPSPNKFKFCIFCYRNYKISIVRYFPFGSINQFGRIPVFLSTKELSMHEFRVILI